MQSPSGGSTNAGLKREIIAQRKKYNETDEKYPNIQKVIDGHWED